MQRVLVEWTPLLFINDIIPEYVRDFRGCMRYTAIFAIEMKLSLFLPIMVQMYFMGLKRTILTVCVILITAGFAINYLLQV